MDIDDYGPLLTAEAFLEIDFGERIKAELEDGELRVLERGPATRVQIAGNLLCAIHAQLRGSGKRTYGSSLALKTGERSVRFPDAAVYGDDRVAAHYADRDLMQRPLLVAHVCRTDRILSRLVDEYRQLASLDALLLVDYERSLVRSVTRADAGEWNDVIVGEGGTVAIAPLGLTISHADIFARD